MDAKLPDSPPFDLSLVANSTPIAATRKRKRTSDFVHHFHSLGLKSPNTHCSTPEKSKPNLSIVASPIQECNAILYENLKNVRAPRRFHPKLTKCAEHTELLNRITSNHVIMHCLFKYLSNGDLFRLNTVSKHFKTAIQLDYYANERLTQYNLIYRVNKENYVITPPNSPEKCDSPPRTTSTNLNRCIKLRKSLSSGQTLNHCMFCGDFAIKENDVCQCPKCLVIYCVRCSSFSQKGPDSFVDKCGNSVLLQQPLGNLSNFSDSGYNSSMNKSAATNESTSSVKRTLFSSSNSMENVGGKKAMDRHSRNEAVYYPVAKNVSNRSLSECCESPPKLVKFCGVGSKQSKRNLKRLTR